MQEYGTENEERIGNLLVYLLEENAYIGRTRLVKSPYVADLVHYNLCDEFITGDSYLIKRYGPMGLVSKRLTETKNPYFEIRSPSNDGVPELRLFSPKLHSAMNNVSPSEKMALDASWRWTKTYGRVEELSTYLHTFKMWDKNRLNSPIPISRNEFSLESREIQKLEEGGILITSFGKYCCDAAKYLPKKYDEIEIKKLEEILRELSRTFPDELWEEHLDCFLAGLDAMRETARTKGGKSAFSRVCEEMKAVSVALAFTPKLNNWVTDALRDYTYNFEDAVSDAIGFGEHLPPVSEDIKEVLAEAMVKVRDDAIRQLNGE